jgi:prefoldin subunit 5
VKEINAALARKKAQLEILGKQIAQLQAAAEELRSVAHLLHDSGDEPGSPADR